MPHAAHGQPADGYRQLDRSHLNIALTDGCRDRIAFIPLLALKSQLPASGRQNSFDFTWKIDSGFLSQPSHLSVLRDRIDPDASARVIKIHVAGLDDRMMQVNGPMDGVAFVIASRKGLAAGAMEARAGLENPA